MSDGLHVTGGYGGTSARLEDLHRAAAALRQAADSLDQADEMLGVAQRATFTGDAFGAGASARAALDQVLRSPSSPARTAENLRRLARALVEAAGTYERAEGTVELAVRAFVGVTASNFGQSPWAPLVGLGATLMAPFAVEAGAVLGWARTGRRPELSDLVSSGAAETLLYGVGTFLRGLQPGVQRLVGAPVGPAVAPIGTLLPRRPLLVVPVFGSTRTLTGADVPASDGDAMRSVSAGYATPGAVEVTRLDHPDGSRSWLVAVPGTQEGSVGGPNPFDMQSNLELLAGQSAAASELTVAAMEQAGIEPGEPVMLAGHSQGGMTAMALAGSATVTARFAITHVLTAGSPVAGMSTQPGVQVLNVEHTTDAIPVLDGRANPDTRDRTTVRRDLSVADDPADRVARHSLLESHDVKLYGRTLDLVDAAADHDASIDAWEESVGSTVFGPQGTTAVVTRYAGIAGVEVPTLSPASR
ncbi:hypothetical protein DDP54_08445 [Cellulomonas sp. WB94]|uniref:hypothetical protein n=1 Tax=Cellulomonas sp. WB94 TaxID=2173174 RepID=UPI000D578C92|nr:hypothetical protein [Cellulomonas sp. WB94]PVU83024.1 hypothetical protein DDP54_08445 [Cellulomonas sp. WB94]